MFATDGLGQLPICVLHSIVLWSIVMASPQQAYNTKVACVYRLRGGLPKDKYGVLRTGDREVDR